MLRLPAGVDQTGLLSWASVTFAKKEGEGGGLIGAYQQLILFFYFYK
jgi:hypothetical protein